jgi:hypothetical protein
MEGQMPNQTQALWLEVKAQQLLPSLRTSLVYQQALAQMVFPPFVSR